MTHRLTTNYAKNYCNRTLIVKFIVENVVTCYFWDTVQFQFNQNQQFQFLYSSRVIILVFILYRFLIVLNFHITECRVICSRTQTFLASSIILPHKPKSKNQPLFSNSTKLNCSNAAVRHKHAAQFSQSKPISTQHFLIQFQTRMHFK